MTVSVDEEELQSFGGLYRQTMAGRFPYVLPVLLLLAGQLAMVFFLTPSILLDWAIYTGLCWRERRASACSSAACYIRWGPRAPRRYS